MTGQHNERGCILKSGGFMRFLVSAVGLEPTTP